MGWTFTDGQTRHQLLQERIRDQQWSNERGTHQRTCLKHCAVGNTLWTVWECVDSFTTGEVTTTRYIGCDLLQRDKDGWGYKDMTEECGPVQRTCPPAYFDLVPMPNREWSQQWRDDCREFYASRKKARAVKEGDILVFEEPIRFRDNTQQSVLKVIKPSPRIVRYTSVEGIGRYRLDTRALRRPHTVMTEAEYRASI